MKGRTERRGMSVVAGSLLLALGMLALACMPLATPMLTEQPDTSQMTGEAPPGATPVQTAVNPPPPSTLAVEVQPTSPAAPFSLVLVGNAFSRTTFTLLGGYREGVWLAPEAIVEDLSVGVPYRSFDLAGFEERAEIASLPGRGAPFGACDQVEVLVEMVAPLQPLAVVLNGDWEPQPRPIEVLSPESEFYLQELEGYLLQAGVVQPEPRLEQVLRSDLDGDGADEVLLAGTHFTLPDAHAVTPGDYSLVLVRRLVGGQVVTERLAGEIYTVEEALAFPPTYSLQGVLDVNADGRLEVIVHRRIWEGYGALLFEYGERGLEPALSLQCGL